MDTEQLDVSLTVVSAFDELNVPYFLGGSMASSAHGIYRATNDADFVADLRPTHASKLVGLIGGGFYADEPSILSAIRSRRSFNLIHLETMLKVDVFVLKDDPFSQGQMARRTLVPISKPPAPELYLASPEDTVLAKLDWYRKGGGTSDRQWNDILGVLKVQADRLDRDYLEHWAGELSVTDLLSRALDDAGLE